MTLTLARPTPETDDTFLADALRGLSASRKYLPSKYFYDAHGSQLFDRICELPEYYPTRTETALMQSCASEMTVCLGPHCRLVELGSGSSIKTRLLLDAAPDLHSYVPVDISAQHLLHTARDLQDRYPHLPLYPLPADYTRPLHLPQTLRSAPERTVAYFPGSTIGNFTPAEAQHFLRTVREWVDDNGGLLIGIDLKKDVGVLEAAYNDRAGVTAAFNRNILERMNRELDADFNLDSFAHWAFYNAFQSRIEMHLLSLGAQTVRVGEHEFEFDAGETMHTENSCKWDRVEFAQFAQDAGWSLKASWTDAKEWFSVLYFAAD